MRSFPYGDTMMQAETAAETAACARRAGAQSVRRETCELSELYSRRRLNTASGMSRITDMTARHTGRT